MFHGERQSSFCVRSSRALGDLDPRTFASVMEERLLPLARRLDRYLEDEGYVR